MNRLTACVFACLTAALALPALSVPVGSAAPDFSLRTLEGKPVKLSDYQGKYVVLEWVNPGCPFVQKHYDSGNMPGLQSKYDVKDTVWLSINSTNTGHQDYMSPDKLKSYLGAKKASPDAYMMDVDGKVGIEYAAKTTPHMYVINPAGMLVYAGAIDDKPSTDEEDVKTAKNFVLTALDEAMAGKPVTASSTQPYGCSVKY